MNKLSRVFSQLALFFTITFIGSLVFLIVYAISNHDALINDLSNITFSSFNNNGIYDDNPSIFGKPSSSYKKISGSLEKTIPISEELSFDLRVAELSFVRENRKDIKVLYEYEKPDTSKFQSDLIINTSPTTLIKEEFEINKLIINVDYKNKLTIFIPEDYIPENINISTKAGNIKNLPEIKGNMEISTDVNDLDLVYEYNLENFVCKSQVGELKLDLRGNIKNVEVSSEVGSVNLSLNSADTFTGSSSVGYFKFTAKDTINEIDLSSEIGKVTLNLNNIGSKINVESSIGEVEMNIDNAPEDFVINAISEIGDVDSQYPISKNEKNYIIKSEIGAIKIK